MKIGTKSLLFGVHQFLWHPFTVYLAWITLYKRLPTIKEAVCILIHDIGYWGRKNMDGEEGQRHPARAANWAYKHLDHKQMIKMKWWGFCFYHSRYLAKRDGTEPSPLCWADKLSICFEPWWFYLLRARLSGEIREYREENVQCGFCPAEDTDKEWFFKVRAFMREQAINQKSSTIYMHTQPAHTGQEGAEK